MLIGPYSDRPIGEQLYLRRWNKARKTANNLRDRCNLFIEDIKKDHLLTPADKKKLIENLKQQINFK